MTHQEQITLYKKFLPLANSLARKAARRHRMPTGELQAEARSLWGKIVAEWPQRYDPARCGECHWAYQQIYWRLLDFCTRQPARKHEVQMSNKADFKAKGNWLPGFLAMLGEDARIVVSTILHAPGEIVEEIMPRGNRPRTRTRTRIALEDYFEDSLGWPMSRFDSAWAEVCGAIYNPETEWACDSQGEWRIAE